MHGTFPAPAGAPPRSRRDALLVLRLAWRELRAGLGGFGVFIACIALGVAAISGVSAVAGSLVGGIQTQGRTILGGDVALSLVQREATPDEVAVLGRWGAVSRVASLRAMVIAGESGAALVEAKAVGRSYPDVGAVVTEPAGPLQGLLAQRDGAYGAVADSGLFIRLGLEPGARVTIGQATIELRARLTSEPDKIAAGLGFGPRLLLSDEALAATGLVQPGSLVRWTYRVLLPTDRDIDPERAATGIQEDLPGSGAGWEIRNRENADPRFTRNIGRFTQFLTLVGLTALLVGGVGVANAVTAFVDRKRGAIGVLKTLGATGDRVVAIYLVQVLFVAGIGIAIGLAIGAAIPFAVAGFFGSVLPIPIAPLVSAADLGIATLYGLLTALAFSLGPLGRAHAITVSGLFRDRVAPDPKRSPLRARVASGVCGALLIGLAIAAAQDRRIALLFVGAAAIAFVLLRLLATGIMAASRRLPPVRQPFLRLALANLHRPGALTPTLVLSLGLGITLLVTLAVIDGSLRREIGRTLPERAPNFFFVDVPAADSNEFRAFLGREAPGGAIEATPMMRGRIVALNDVAASEAKPSPEAAWVLDGDRGITFSAAVPEGSVVTDGQWWPADVSGPPLVSMDAEIARGLGLSVGGTVTVNVLGRTVTAKIANLRRIDWRRIGIGFVLVFSPQSFAGAPYTELVTVALPKSADPAIEPRLLRAAAHDFPAITTIRVKEALEAIDAVVAQLLFAIRAASSIALAASLLVLAGALAAGQRARIYDAVVLKTLGATRMRLLGAYLVEYGVLGLITATFGMVAGTLAAYGVVAKVMKLDFTPSVGAAAASAALAVVVALALGLLGTWRVLGQKPARFLKSL